ncbi:MAG: prolipoprotein diacylglyceryl transferase family protein [Bryobacteraceae bacterium]
MLWHLVFESAAYFVAFRLYLSARRRGGDFLDTHTRWSVVLAAIAGAAVGSKVLFWAEDPVRTLHNGTNLEYLLRGKTVVGAILGGTLAVEWMKRRLRVTRRTGDLFAVPLAVGIAIGRIGCALAGVHDDTHGVATALPWGIDFGDGIRRHPVQLYESAAMVLLALALGRIGPPRFAEGDRFRVFLLAYCGWRVLIDFLKPGVRFLGLTTLQWCSLAALLWYTKDLMRMLQRNPCKNAVAHV